MVLFILAAPIYILIDSAQGSIFSKTSLKLVVSCLFDGSHSDNCEEMSHCGFNLHFPDD